MKMRSKNKVIAIRINNETHSLYKYLKDRYVFDTGEWVEQELINLAIYLDSNNRTQSLSEEIKNYVEEFKYNYKTDIIRANRAKWFSMNTIFKRAVTKVMQFIMLNPHLKSSRLKKKCLQLVEKYLGEAESYCTEDIIQDVRGLKIFLEELPDEDYLSMKNRIFKKYDVFNGVHKIEVRNKQVI